MVRSTTLAALVLCLGCDSANTVEVTMCGNLVIPGERTHSVVVDGAVVDERDLVDAGSGEPAEPEGEAEDQFDQTTPVQVDALRVVALDGDFEELASAVTELSSGSDLKVRGFDVKSDFPLPASTRWLAVQGLLESVVVHWTSRVVSEPSELDAVSFQLGRKCYGVMCAKGQTCDVDGCALVPTPEEGKGCSE